MSMNEKQFCMCIVPPERAGQTKAALLNRYRWGPGTLLKVRFLEGASALRERVKAVATGWTGPKMANLTFKFIDSGDADVRIAFKQGNGSWSYLGTYCQQVPAAQPTMNYGWLTPSSSEDEVHRVVSHEFGHALGLIHEHQNPEKPIHWNRAAVIQDLSQPPNNWDEATIENNIFKRYAPGEVTGTPVDASSIMMYPIPKSWTTDGFSAGLNSDLSPTDREFIRGEYRW